MEKRKLVTTNHCHLIGMKKAVLAGRTWVDLRDELATEHGLFYKHPDYLASIFRGDSRPSYLLAEALMKIANKNIRLSKTKKWSKIFRQRGVRIRAKKFELRRLPFAHVENNTHEYFYTTPDYVQSVTHLYN